MRKKNERLKWARERAGYETATDAANAFGWVVPTYLSHENGTRGFTSTTAERYADCFKIKLGWLISNEGSPTGRPTTIKVVGYIGGGNEITPVDDYAMGDGLEEVDAPPGDEDEDAVAVRVRGNSMYPAYHDGDILYYNIIFEDPSPLIGKECVVRLQDGRMFVKTLARGTTNSTYTLNSHNDEPRYDQDLEWAAPIRWVKKA